MTQLLQKSDELTRRRFIATCAKAFLGVGLLPITENFFATTALAATSRPPSPKRIGRAKSVIYLYMSGGMSHLDTFDVKPRTKEQGPTQAIKSNVDGYLISEYLPRLAAGMDKVCIVNSMNSNQGAHEQGNYFQHTSYTLRGTIRHPSLGAWMMRWQDRFNKTLPASVVIGDASRHPGAGFMEAKFAPVLLSNPANGLANARRAGGVTQEDFAFRRKLSEQLDSRFRETYDLKEVRAYTSMYHDAIRLMSSADLAAFDINQETAELRRTYGDHPFGQGCLLARRLVEHGVRFVEVTLGGWDTHNANFLRVPENCEILDKGMSSLLCDLGQRGLLDDTLVVLATEFGRTPEINVNEGRDHYARAFSGLLAGGGIRGGMVYGKTDRGRQVIENEVSIPDFNATIAAALGLPLAETVTSPSKRPFTIADEGHPIMDVFA
ncbi:MAG: DUF1501 domain-containing protein [Verrucomicrobiales bacterium]